MLIELLLSSQCVTGTPATGPDPETVRAAEAFAESVASERPTVRAASAQSAAGADAFINVGRGPVPVHVPVGYDGSNETPLVVLLHGYMNTGQEVENWLQLAAIVDEYEFFLTYPTGETDFLGFEYWNATNACCDLFGSGIDDSTYLSDIVGEMQDLYNIDANRIHFVGHSNGGFMSYRMACDHADLVASLVSLSGATYQNASACSPSEPVHTLQVHGTSDGVIFHGGGCIPLGGCYPSAPQTSALWGTYNGSTTGPVLVPGLIDVDGGQPGAETIVRRYEPDDPATGAVAERWEIPGGAHSPNYVSNMNRLILDFLYAHPRAGTSNCPTDINNDGSVGFSDLASLLSQWGACAGCSADFDGSGAVDFSDLVSLVGSWGPCE